MRQWEEEKHQVRKSGRSLLTAERIDKLKSIGLEPTVGKWQKLKKYMLRNYLSDSTTSLVSSGKGAFGKFCSRNTSEWEKQFSNLLKYRDAKGDCKVPTKKTTLGRWVSSQRKQYRQFLTDTRGNQPVDWSGELHNRFLRLANIGFDFHIGKGNAQQRKSNASQIACSSATFD